MLNESTIKVYTNRETAIGSSPVDNVVKCYCMQNVPTNTVVEKIKIVQTTGDDETVVMSQKAVTDALSIIEAKINGDSE